MKTIKFVLSLAVALIVVYNANKGRHTCMVEHNGEIVITAVPFSSD